MPQPEPLPRTTTRERVEAASVPALEAVGRWPKPLVALLLAGALLVALLVDGAWAAVVLVPALAFVGWLTYLAWPRLRAGQQLLRIVVLSLLLLAVVRRLTG